VNITMHGATIKKNLPSYLHPEDHEPQGSTFLENVTITYIQTHLAMVSVVEVFEALGNARRYVLYERNQDTLWNHQ